MTPLAFITCLLLMAQADPPPSAPPLKIGTVAMQTAEWTDVTIDESGTLHGKVAGETKSLPLSDVLRMAPVHGEKARTSRASRDPMVTVFLDGGGVLSGDLIETGPPATRRLHVSLASELVINVPFAAIAAVRTAPSQPDAEADLQERMADRKPGRDVLLLVREGRPVAVPGSLERLTPREWEFAFESKSRTGPLSQAYGFILGAPGVDTEELPARLNLQGGHRFAATVRSADAGGVRVDAGQLGTMVIPWSHIRSIELQSDRLVHLSELKPAEVETQSLTEAPWPPRMDTNVTGGPLRIARTKYSRGVGVHAHSRLTFKLDKAFEKFHALAGVDSAVAPAGTVVFRVIGDGKTLFESPVVRGGDGPVSITLDVAGVETLVLECDPSDDLDLSDHGNWVDAILIKAGREGST